ncbi:MAG TPA: glycosyltransferase [Cyclobacteriaceae bacterium]|nr:glycosyltransferase [Cyclobacteriaceae bacterium]
MKFSIVIPTRNRNEMLEQCVASLQPGTQFVDEREYEILVTDDGLAAKDVCRKFSATRWVAGPARGPAANRNNGARYARGEWIIFVDDDCIPDPGFLWAYSQAISDNPGMKVFEGRTYPERARQRMDEDAPINETGGCLWSCNFMIEKRLFDSLGGFNEGFPYAAMEDVEFADRVRKITQVIFVHQASVLHPWRLVADPATKYKRAFESHKIYFRINPEAIQKFRVGGLCVQFASSIVRNTLKDVIRFRGRGIQFPLQYHFFQLRLIIHIARLKLRIS